MGNGSVFFARAMLRLPLAAFGLAAAGWGAGMFPGFVRGTTIERVATRIIMMEPYRLDVLKSVLDFNQIVVPAGLCRPSNARAAAIIQIKIFEATFGDGGGEDIDREQANLTDRLAQAFDCAPPDPYLMLALFWQRNMAVGLDATSLAFLDWSYRLGPNEGWVAFRRNRFAAVLLPNVPPELARKILDEFRRLLESRFFLEALDIYRAADAESRKRLLAQLDSTDEFTRRAFFGALRNADLDPPDMKPPESEVRPWQRR